ncbi:MAG: oxygen-independent coproporphyrinogen III oxidase [Desulfatitalea sp.]|nr:oxygen-independent coproporphyrinogen III oxidase [Desulfatitalea sp.]NNK00643.1 oxygen-independent coproporphyrinogen III oxidase [Desulfatitalea sp.]
MDHTSIPKIDQLARKYNEANIPLYLSYPTSNWWNKPLDEDEFVKTHGSGLPPFLYFHFPYCRTPCYYCMCYKYVSNDTRHNDIYIDYLQKEFSHTLDRLGINGQNRVRHVHWGGGTPTYLTCAQIDKVHRALFSRLTLIEGAAAGKSIEAYPDEQILTEEKLRLLSDLGFTEISLGIQDFDERIQKTINRNCTTKTVHRIIDRARKFGFRVHIDLCYGLPFQGLNELEKSVKEVIRMAPDRVALFTYVHYPHIFPLQRKIPTASIPNSFIRVLLAMLANDLFDAHGFKKVGYDHYVKDNDVLYQALLNRKVIRDFMGYSVDHKREFMGFGNSAISFPGDGFYQNIQSLKNYYRAVDDARIPIEGRMTHQLTPEDRLRNEVIQKSILSDFSIRKREINRGFDIHFDDYFRPELEKLVQLEHDGLVDLSDQDTIQVTRIGAYFARHIAHVFDTYYDRREFLN